MAGDVAWMRAEMGGTTRASVITKPEVIGALLIRAKRPLFIIGHEIVAAEPESEILTEFIEAGSRIRHIPILGTAHTVKDLISKGIRVSAIMGSMEIVDRLRDPEWTGIDGKGQYDLVLMAGIPYSLGWILLSGIRNGVPDLKTIMLDRRYQPHATWSFGNMATGQWREQLQALIKLLEKR